VAREGSIERQLNPRILNTLYLSRVGTPHCYLGENRQDARISASSLASNLELLRRGDTGHRISGVIFNASVARTDQQALNTGNHRPVPAVWFLPHSHDVAEDFTDRSLDKLAALRQDTETRVSAICLFERITNEATQRLRA